MKRSEFIKSERARNLSIAAMAHAVGDKISETFAILAMDMCTAALDASCQLRVDSRHWDIKP